MSRSRASGARFRRASDQSLLVCFGEQISQEAHDRVRRLLCLLETEPLAAVQNLHPGYCSLLVKFDPRKLDHAELERSLQSFLVRLDQVSLPKPRLVDIPVCYGGEFGPDLGDVAALHGLPEAQAIELHGSARYTVYFLGFVPGFAYLGELPDALVTPRLPNPRRQVPRGSVAIAGKQTGVYPLETPGGWRLIGRTPLAMFRPGARPMSLLSIGDQVHFVAISREEFARLEEP